MRQGVKGAVYCKMQHTRHRVKDAVYKTWSERCNLFYMWSEQGSVLYMELKMQCTRHRVTMQCTGH